MTSRFGSMNRHIGMFVALAVGLSIVAMGVIWIIYNRAALEKQAERLYTIQVEMIGSAMKPAMMFNDSKMANDLLATLLINPDITAIHFYSADGTLLAGFPERQETLTSDMLQQSKSLFEKDEFILWQPVYHKDALVGSIHVRIDLNELTGRHHADIVNIIFIMLAILFASIGIVARLQRKLSESETKLYAAVRQAESASHAKSDFLSTMSHELRTPIHGIIGLHRLIIDEMDNLTDEQRENLMLAQQSAQSLQALVNDILDLGKIESGNLELNESELDLKQIVCESMIPFRVPTLKKGVLLSLHIHGAPVRIVADETRLRQVLLNLIGNAVKFTEHGEISVDITPQDHHLLFSIRDTGQGISAEDLERIFEPFVQGRRNRNNEQKGTGLGTSIARRLVELMGGTISVSSKPGEGTCFAFDIPCRSVGDAVQDMDIDSLRGLFIHARNLHPPVSEETSSALRVLLAEDDPVGRRIAGKQLASVGIDVDAVTSGTAAWEKLQENRYDLLLTDIRMPGMSGIELTRRIREKESVSGAERLPIIGLSAHAMDAVVQECMEAGMDHFMAKPVDPNRIISAILGCAAK